MDQKKVGKYIATKRKEKGFTQEQLAEKLGIGHKSVSKWERGVCLPDVSKYEDICAILGITLNDFFAGEDLGGEVFASQTEKNLLELAISEQKKHNKLKILVLILLVLLALASMFYYRFEYSVVVRDTENLGWLTYEMPEEGYIHRKEDIITNGDKIVGKIYTSERNNSQITVAEHGSIDYKPAVGEDTNWFITDTTTSFGENDDKNYPYYYKVQIKTYIGGLVRTYEVTVKGQFNEGVKFLAESLIESMHYDTDLEEEYIKDVWILF